MRISQLQSLFGFVCVLNQSVFVNSLTGVCKLGHPAWGNAQTRLCQDPSGDRGCRGLPAALAEPTNPWLVSVSPGHIWAKQKCHWLRRVKLQQGPPVLGEGTSHYAASALGNSERCHGTGWLLHPCGIWGLMPLAPGGSLGYCPAHPSASFCRRSYTWGLSNCLIVHPREKLSLSAGAALWLARQPRKLRVSMPSTSHL